MSYTQNVIIPVVANMVQEMPPMHKTTTNHRKSYYMTSIPKSPKNIPKNSSHVATKGAPVRQQKPNHQAQVSRDHSLGIGTSWRSKLGWEWATEKMLIPGWRKSSLKVNKESMSPIPWLNSNDIGIMVFSGSYEYKSILWNIGVSNCFQGLKKISHSGSDTLRVWDSVSCSNLVPRSCWKGLQGSATGSIHSQVY